MIGVGDGVVGGGGREREREKRERVPLPSVVILLHYRISVFILYVIAHSSPLTPQFQIGTPSANKTQIGLPNETN